MSLRYALLGLLSLKSGTGYDLKAHLNQTVRYLWNADQAQVYRTLADLTAEGLTRYRIEFQEGKPNRKIYELTAEGRDDLVRWLNRPIPPPEPKNGELLQLFFSGINTDEGVRERLQVIARNYEYGLGSLAETTGESPLFDPGESDPRVLYFFEKTRELGLRTLRLNREWLAEILSDLESGRVPGGGKS
jgi:DNA-binding PadR family transcriptional regulator